MESLVIFLVILFGSVDNTTNSSASDDQSVSAFSSRKGYQAYQAK